MTPDPFRVLEEQLAGAVARRARRRRLGPRGLAGVVAATLAAGSGAAVASGVLGPDDQPDAQVRQALFAGRQAAAGAPARRTATRGGKPRVVDEPVPAAVARRLGVLRRPATAADRRVEPPGFLGATDVLRGSLRSARAHDGWRFELALASGVPGRTGGARDPLRCARVRAQAVVRAAEGFDAAVRARVRAIVDRELRRLAELERGTVLNLAISAVRPDGRPAGGGATIVRGGRIPATGSVGPVRVGDRRSVDLSGLVPDGVADVRVSDRDGAPRVRPVVVPVRDNVFHALLPRRMGPRMTVAWRTARGRVVRRTHPRY